jgi:hypothetical protein
MEARKPAAAGLAGALELTAVAVGQLRLEEEAMQAVHLPTNAAIPLPNLWVWTVFGRDGVVRPLREYLRVELCQVDLPAVSFFSSSWRQL